MPEISPTGAEVAQREVERHLVVVLDTHIMVGSAVDSKGPRYSGSRDMAYYMYRDVAGYWRWYLRAVNGRKIADSGEGYHNRQDCFSAIKLVQGSGSMPIYDQ